MKKTLLILLLVIGYLLVGPLVKAEQIQSFDSQISINKDGTIDVKETIIYDFETESKRGIYRDIPFIKTNQDGNPTSPKASLGARKFQLDFSDFSVKDENGYDYKFTKSTINEQVIRLNIGDANKYVTGVHNYIISYKVAGALTYFSDHDELYWNVNGNQWTVPTLVLTSEVGTPPGIKKKDVKTVCYTGDYGSKESLCSIELLSLSDRTKMVINSNRSLESGEGLTIAISFPKNIVAVLEPREFIPFSETLLGRLVMGLIGLMGLIWYVFLPVYIIYRWIRYGRDPSTPSGRSGQVRAWFDPPKTQDGKRFLTPGEVGALGDETVDMKDISATIVDLARRGYLVIDERKKGDYWLIKKNMVPTRTGDKLLVFEKMILDKFFNGEPSFVKASTFDESSADKSAGKSEIRIKDQELSSEVIQIKNEMYKQIVEDKLFDKNPETTRTLYYVLAAVALFTANFGLAIVAFVFGRVMPRKTVFGVEAKNVAFSLKNFLTSQKRQLEFQANKQLMFERLLPFAVAFGVEKIWAKRFESLDITQPSWYHSSSPSHFNSYLFVSSLNSSFKSLSTAATPTRSSSGFSSGFSGGSSGGGGGGGGGGSW